MDRMTNSLSLADETIPNPRFWMFVPSSCFFSVLFTNMQVEQFSSDHINMDGDVGQVDQSRRPGMGSSEPRLLISLLYPGWVARVPCPSPPARPWMRYLSRLSANHITSSGIELISGPIFVSSQKKSFWAEVPSVTRRPTTNVDAIAQQSQSWEPLQYQRITCPLCRTSRTGLGCRTPWFATRAMSGPEAERVLFLCFYVFFPELFHRLASIERLKRY